MRSLQDSLSLLFLLESTLGWCASSKAKERINKTPFFFSFNSSLSVWHARSFPLLGGPKSFVTLRGYSAAAAVAGKLRYPRVSLWWWKMCGKSRGEMSDEMMMRKQHTNDKERFLKKSKLSGRNKSWPIASWRISWMLLRCNLYISAGVDCKRRKNKKQASVWLPPLLMKLVFHDVPTKRTRFVI